MRERQHTHKNRYTDRETHKHIQSDTVVGNLHTHKDTCLHWHTQFISKHTYMCIPMQEFSYKHNTNAITQRCTLTHTNNRLLDTLNGPCGQPTSKSASEKQAIGMVTGMAGETAGGKRSYEGVSSYCETES